METLTTQQALPLPVKSSPVKIHPEDNVDALKCSLAVTLAETCGISVRERSASTVSLVKSSETSEVRREDGTSEAAEKGLTKHLVQDLAIKESHVFHMQRHMQSMQQRVNRLQLILQEAARCSRLGSSLQKSTTGSMRSTSMTQVDVLTNDLTQANLGSHKIQWAHLASSFALKTARHALINEPNDMKERQQNGSFTNVDVVSIANAELLKKTETLQVELKNARDENKQLQLTVLSLEKKLAQLHNQKGTNSLIELGSNQISNNALDDKASQDHENSHSRFKVAQFGRPTAIQMVIEEDMTVLRNHEQCQRKLHELWDIAKKLRAYVELYQFERDVMKTQRDDAIADSKRAEAEIIQLASSSNPQQRIKYLQKIKRDNQVLRQKNRALNVRIAKMTISRHKNVCQSAADNNESSIDTTLKPLALGDMLQDERDESVTWSGDEYIRNIRERGERLERRLESLRLARRSVHGILENESSNHLDSYASAAGLLQLRSASAEANVEIPTSSPYDQECNHIDNSSDSPAISSTPPLPPGWHQIMHGSGLPCYVHDVLGVVCWTRPYLLNIKGEGPESQQELHSLVRQHLPPVSIFTPRLDLAERKKNDLSGVNNVATKMSSVYLQESNSKKRKLDVLKGDQTAIGKQQSMTLNEFKNLSIDDPRVLQACMELSIKTPAQVLQEYQNRNRGVSINYNMTSIEGDGVKLFKTIVTAGSTVAEGIASTKKIAKQLGAQQLLAMLHERTAKKYYEVAEMYNSSLRGQYVTAESFVYGPAIPLLTGCKDGRIDSGHVDPRLQRGANALGRMDPRLQRGGSASIRTGRTRRLVSDHEDVPGYCEYKPDRHVNAPSCRNKYKYQHVSQQSIPWTLDDDSRTDRVGSERIVVYSQSATGTAGNGDEQNCGSSWSGNSTANYLQQQNNIPRDCIQQSNNNLSYGKYSDTLSLTHLI
ncbi:WW domain [Plasmopara halstedii]|uniref:WW domain n=1 Tax=Plasmopara halstedii TaxID=4781 RepID=A0A0P1AA77_PLAHL|nr:WW domain [Plasmopara halstedii]CEG37463.1 WW domain [Plasmopara halstedii]|eukprot:XP_024573832.1 WW domain [Plasmopara halstedii]